MYHVSAISSATRCASTSLSTGSACAARACVSRSMRPRSAPRPASAPAFGQGGSTTQSPARVHQNYPKPTRHFLLKIHGVGFIDKTTPVQRLLARGVYHRHLPADTICTSKPKLGYLKFSSIRACHCSVQHRHDPFRCLPSQWTSSVRFGCAPNPCDYLVTATAGQGSMGTVADAQLAHSVC